MPSHGALNKAGKVRSVTPKLESQIRKSSGPRVNNRKLYNRRVILGRSNGQYRPDDRHYMRRRR